MSIIEIQPTDALQFPKPLVEGSKDTIRIRNALPPSNELNYIAFKVKTTAPKSFTVRPNSGRLAPGQITDIQVQIQEDPGVKPSKFLVQAIRISKTLFDMPETESYLAVMQDQWNRAEDLKKTDPSFMTEKKLRVQFGQEQREPPLPRPTIQEYQGVPVRQVSLGDKDTLSQISQLKSSLASTEDNLRSLDSTLRQRNVHDLMAGQGATPSRQGPAGSSITMLSPKKEGDVKDVIVAQLWRVGEMRIKVKFALLFAFVSFLLGVLFF